MLTGFDLCRAALAVTGISAPEKGVLMVLAIMADKDDATCFPPINGDAGLTAKTCLSERAVQRAIQRLKDLGHISRRQLRHGCIYTVHPKPTPATETGVSVTGDTGTPVSHTPVTQAERGAPVAPKQPVTTKSKRIAGTAKPKPTRVPLDFTPQPKAGSLTAKAMNDWPPGQLDEQVEHFVDHHATHGTTSLDWQASWRTWVKNWKRFNGQRPHHHRNGRPAGNPRSHEMDDVFRGFGIG